MKFDVIVEDRKGKKALWIQIPNPYDDKTTPYNIWDLPPDLASNNDVLCAISRAFELGALSIQNLVKRPLHSGAASIEFEFP